MAVIYKELLPHISEILLRRDGSVKVSIEFIIEEAEVSNEGYVVVKK